MQFQISVLNVDKISKTTKTGNSYFQIEVSYKELGTGKVSSKKIMPFGSTADAHKKLIDAKQGEVFTVTAEKGEPNAEGKSFWEWQGVVQAAPGSAAPAAQASATTPASAPAARSGGSWETPEERASKQVLIVKQSSLNAAVATLAPGAKGALDPAKVKQLAQEYTDFVFGKEEKKNLFDMPSDNLDDDIPM
jgi:hypothetical protein